MVWAAKVTVGRGFRICRGLQRLRSAKPFGRRRARGVWDTSWTRCTSSQVTGLHSKVYKVGISVGTSGERMGDGRARRRGAASTP